MKKLLALDARPDGVFCYNDPIAIGVIDAVLEAGLRVPEDIAVIGCGNLHFDKSLRVPLSSVDQQSRAIGERAGKLVLSLIEAKVAPRPKEHHAPAVRRATRVHTKGTVQTFGIISSSPPLTTVRPRPMRRRSSSAATWACCRRCATAS